MSMFSGLFGGSSSGGISHGANGPTAIQPNPTAATQQPTSNTQQPAGQQQTANDQQQQSPADSSLDSLKAFWQPVVDAEGKPVAAQVDPTAATLFSFDPKVVQESSRKLDFTSGLDPELVTKALGGDQAAFMATLNHAVQNAVTAVTLNTGNMINQGVNTNNQRFKELLPTQIKRVQLDQTTSANPIFQHDAVAPLVNALKSMHFAKNPNANPADVQAQVEGLLQGLSTAVYETTAPGIASKKAATAGEQDWSSFLD